MGHLPSERWVQTLRQEGIETAMSRTVIHGLGWVDSRGINRRMRSVNTCWRGRATQPVRPPVFKDESPGHVGVVRNITGPFCVTESWLRCHHRAWCELSLLLRRRDKGKQREVRAPCRLRLGSTLTEMLSAYRNWYGEESVDLCSPSQMSAESWTAASASTVRGSEERAGHSRRCREDETRCALPGQM